MEDGKGRGGGDLVGGDQVLAGSLLTGQHFVAQVTGNHTFHWAACLWEKQEMVFIQVFYVHLHFADGTFVG